MIYFEFMYVLFKKKFRRNKVKHFCSQNLIYLNLNLSGVTYR